MRKRRTPKARNKVLNWFSNLSIKEQRDIEDEFASQIYPLVIKYTAYRLYQRKIAQQYWDDIQSETAWQAWILWLKTLMRFSDENERIKYFWKGVENIRKTSIKKVMRSFEAINFASLCGSEDEDHENDFTRLDRDLANEFMNAENKNWFLSRCIAEILENASEPEYKYISWVKTGCVGEPNSEILKGRKKLAKRYNLSLKLLPC